MDVRTLTGAQRRLRDETCRGTHHRRVELEVYRRSNGKAMFSITDAFLGGSVNGDLARVPVEVMECDVYDEDFTFDWTHGAHRKYRVRVIDSRFVPDLNDWVEEVVFTGPLWRFTRSGPIAHLVAEGSEMEALGSVRQAEFWPARTEATDVVKELLRAAGATARDMRIPNLKRPLPKDVTIGVELGKDRDKDKKGFQGPEPQRLVVSREDTYYGVAAPIVEALDRDFYTDGPGRFVVESHKSRPTLRLEESDLLAPVEGKPADEDGEAPNTWIVIGANPDGPKEQVRVKVDLPKKHPSSAHEQRWNEKRREVIETIKNKHLRTDHEARKVGERKRDRAKREKMQYEVSALLVRPWFRPGSLMSVPVNGGRTTARITRWTRPLGPGADGLTLGATKARGF